VRESMRECNAYEEQMRGKTSARAPAWLGPEDEEGDMLGQSVAEWARLTSPPFQQLTRRRVSLDGPFSESVRVRICLEEK
jgi:hypothetical protein